jgi:hypothetical protein
VWGAAGAGDPPVPGLNCSQAPEIFSSCSTRSVGWAPFCSQATALSLSTLISDGSCRGS